MDLSTASSIEVFHLVIVQSTLPKVINFAPTNRNSPIILIQVKIATISLQKAQLNKVINK
jgi:hypothetical protein